MPRVFFRVQIDRGGGDRAVPQIVLDMMHRVAGFGLMRRGGVP
jgi:glutaredoxin